MFDTLIFGIRRRDFGRRLPIDDAFLSTREITGLGSGRDARSNRIQIHVSHAGRNRHFIQKRLYFVASLPKMALDVFFTIPAFCDRLAQTFHKPRNIRQPLTLFFQPRCVVANVIEFKFGRFGRRTILLASKRKQIPPTHSDFVIGPCLDKIGPRSGDDMHVIAKDREPHDVNGEDPGQNFEAISNPVFPMGEISPGIFINPAEKRASDTAIDQMKDLYFIVRKDFTPIDSWHCRLSRDFETDHP